MKSSSRVRLYLRCAFGIGLIGSLVLIALQIYAPSTDYQQAFLRTAGVGIATVLLVLVFLQLASSRVGHPWRVPTVAAVAMIMLVATVRVKTFSGELVPQLEWRFAAHKVPDLRLPTQTLPSETLPDADASSERVTESGLGIDDAVADSLAEVASADEASQWTLTWGQFLGNQRDGVVKSRMFSIPESIDEIETLWNIGIGEGWSSFAIATNPNGQGIAITLEQRDQRECVTAYDLATGELRWLVDHEANHFNALGEGGPRSTPAIEGDLVYAQGATGTVWCVKIETGEVIWKVDLLKIAGWDQTESENVITWGRSGSPLIVDGLCVVPLGGPDGTTDRAIIALDAATGEIQWRSGDQQISYASPQVFELAGMRQIVSVNESDITGHRIDTGEILWQTDWEGQSNGGANCAAAIPVGENRFLIGKGYGGGSALIEISQDGETWQATDVWRSNRILQTKFNHCVVKDGVAFGLSNGALQAVELESGERLWTQGRRGRYGQGQVILAGDVMIVQGEMGEVAFVEANPNEFNEWMRIEALHQKTWNIPSLSGNVLLVRNGEEAVAMKLPSR